MEKKEKIKQTNRQYYNLSFLRNILLEVELPMPYPSKCDHVLIKIFQR